MRIIGWVVALLGAAMLAFAGVGCISAGGGLLVAGSAFSDNGFLATQSLGFSTPRYALTSSVLSVAPHPSDWLPPGLAKIRLKLTPQSGKPLFVGIGPSSDVQRYLSGVARDEFSPPLSKGALVARTVEGAAPVGTPGTQTFWAASVELSSGPVELDWDVKPGLWTLAVLNADASPTVAVAIRLGADVPMLLPMAVIMIVIGIVLAVGAAMILMAAATSGGGSAAIKPSPTTEPAHPVVLTGHLDLVLSRWLWLIKWFLAIPHLVVLAFLWIAFWMVTVVAFFAILVTGRYPRRLFEFNVGVLRWTWRVLFYAFNPAATDRYPPFTLGPANYPASLEIAYPSRLSRGLIFVKWLLAIPHLVIVGLFTNGLIWWAGDPGSGAGVLRIGGGLVGILVLVALIALLIGGRYLGGLFDLVMGLDRWIFRVLAYVALLRDDYPPFRLDLGPTEPDGPAEDLLGGPLPAGPVSA